MATFLWIVESFIEKGNCPPIYDGKVEETIGSAILPSYIPMIETVDSSSANL